MSEIMVLLLTATVQPNLNTPFLAIKDQTERLEQYIDCIHFFLDKSRITDIVLCDNSNIDSCLFSDVIAEANMKKKKLEILSFRGNADKVIQFGKGYGEGEIVNYAIKNSTLIKKNGYFLKITGRLKVNNIDDLVERLKYNKIYINRSETKERKYANTRLYAMSSADYDTYFSKVHLNVNDASSYYLENAFRDCIVTNKISTYNFPVFPRIIGYSGSTGAKYIFSEKKCKIKDLLSMVNYYRVK